MKENELRKHATCSNCNKKIGHTGLPCFWTLTVNRYGVNMRAVEDQDSLGAMLGSSYLASVMGTDQDLASKIMDEVTLTICEDCMADRLMVMELAFRAAEEGTDD